jgi:uncharacterized protein (TIGR02453 family)
MAAMAFRGWPVEAVEFFEGLEADNSKAYWQAHKETYDTVVRPPMEALLAELEPEWGEGRIFRPYRDVRFSADKSPYKTNIAAMIGPRYVQLTADGLSAGAGMWEMAPDQLERYREAVDQERSGSALEDIVATIHGNGAETMGHSVLKTAPKGYPKDHPRIELLRYKGIVAWREWPVDSWLGTKRARDRVAELFRAAEPLNAWLDAHVGPSTASRTR